MPYLARANQRSMLMKRGIESKSECVYVNVASLKIKVSKSEATKAKTWQSHTNKQTNKCEKNWLHGPFVMNLNLNRFEWGMKLQHHISSYSRGVVKYTAKFWRTLSHESTLK